MIENYLTQPGPLLDVRSPSEYHQGHIPGAHSLPLFSDQERAQVGTLYKQTGKNAAVKLGLQIVGPKLAALVEEAEKLGTKTVRIYCWRGGMRSSSLAWLLTTAGFHCTLLTGGYKAFRRWTLSQFQKHYPLHVIGGLTGSGKSELLKELEHKEQVIDLEEIANHRGSSFGHLGASPQPTPEHFENILAWQLSRCDLNKTIWIEDESRTIGTCRIPNPFWEQMSHAPLLWLNCTKEQRVARLLRDYGGYPAEALIKATERIAKKLGPLRTKEIVESIHNQNLEFAISSILDYYDRSYAYACQKRPRAITTFQ